MDFPFCPQNTHTRIPTEYNLIEFTFSLHFVTSVPFDPFASDAEAELVPYYSLRPLIPLILINF